MCNFNVEVWRKGGSFVACFAIIEIMENDRKNAIKNNFAFVLKKEAIGSIHVEAGA
jgi:hypothetical protein